jgi:HPt (histidine-containing phosphotransfer) domain-containing protein
VSTGESTSTGDFPNDDCWIFSKRCKVKHAPSLLGIRGRVFDRRQSNDDAESGFDVRGKVHIISLTADPRLIDWEQMDMIADGYSPEFLEILGEFLAEIPVMLESLAGLESSGDLDKASKVAHQIKGSAANFGFLAVSSAAAEIESLTKSGSRENVGSLIGRAENDFGLSVVELREKRAGQV